MAVEIANLQERKRELLRRSQSYRESLDSDLQEVKTATAWVPKTIRVLRAAYPVLLVAAPLLGYAFTKKRRQGPVSAEPSPRRGMLASALAGYRLFRKIKPVWDGFRDWQR